MRKDDFPVLKNNPEIIYLDNAASSLKPYPVIEKIDYYYHKLGVNVHRGVYGLSYEATDLYEEARQTVADFINAQFEEIVYTRGASSALNLVALSYGMNNINAGDEIITSEQEHHSSHMPWINVAKIKGAIIKYIPLDEKGRVTIANFKSVLSNKTKVVAINHVSNVMGYLNPIKEIIELAHAVGAVVTVDGAQSVPHMPIDVKEMDCDFLSFSGHKMCGPTGIGILYGKKALLDEMVPMELGGDMAQDVYKESYTYKDTPYKFEVGTPLISEAIGLGAAIKYLQEVGMENIWEQEKSLHSYAVEKLKGLEGLVLYNPEADAGIVTFNIEGIHPHDVASVLDNMHVCVRAGHHCAQLITRWLKTISTVRASLYFYNTKEDIDCLVTAVSEAIKFFKQF